MRARLAPAGAVSVEFDGFLARIVLDTTGPTRVVAIVTREAVEEAVRIWRRPYSAWRIAGLSSRIEGRRQWSAATGTAPRPCGNTGPWTARAGH